MLTSKDTAYAIAWVRMKEAERPIDERLFDDPYAAIFNAAGAHAEEGTKRFASLPFFIDGVRLRTRALDDFLREGLLAGARQVAIMGAGFDARALRIAEIQACGARVFEIDFGEQLAHKRALLEASGIALPAFVKYVGCDFSAPNFEATLLSDLERAGFVEGAGAIFLWEGVIAYISADAQAHSLRFMAHAGGAGSRVAFDFSPMMFEPDPAEARTKRAGFSSFTSESCATLWSRYLPGDPPAGAEIPHIGRATI